MFKNTCLSAMTNDDLLLLVRNVSHGNGMSTYMLYYIAKNTFCLCRIVLTLQHLLSRSTSLLVNLFIEIKAFITDYSDEVLY